MAWGMQSTLASNPRYFFFFRPHVEYMHMTTREFTHLAGRLFIRTFFCESQKEPQPFTTVTLLNFCCAFFIVQTLPPFSLPFSFSLACTNLFHFSPVLGKHFSFYFFFPFSFRDVFFLFRKVEVFTCTSFFKTFPWRLCSYQWVLCRWNRCSLDERNPLNMVNGWSVRGLSEKDRICLYISAP